MSLSDLAIKRPVVACVINLLLIVFGVLALNQLPLREYPDVAAPIVSIRADYSGASADIMESRVLKVIEDQLSGIDGLKTIDSSASAGRGRIKVEFDASRDIEAAANDVRDAVAKAQRSLPVNMKTPTVEKSDADGDGVISYAVSSTTLSAVALSDYVSRQFVQPLSLLDGVSSIELRGEQPYALLVQLDPVAMASRNVTVSDVETALKNENLEAPAGNLSDQARSYALRLERSYLSVEDYRRLIVRRNEDGSNLYLSDIATVTTGSKDDQTVLRVDGQAMVMMEFLKQSQANTLEVVNGIKAEVERLTPFLPQGMSIKPLSDSSVFIESAIGEVYSTLAITSVLVILVIYTFLGSARATLIPAVSVPVSLVATFAVLALFGFSINLITLLALVLVVGLLVDDSIVVLENIVRRIDAGEPPMLAAYRGTREVGTAVIATTAVLVAVFIPITLLSGTVGLLFREYAITLSAAVVISSIVALTMGPVLGNRLLTMNVKPSALHRLMDRLFQVLEGHYRALVVRITNRSWLAVALVVMSLGFIGWCYQVVPQSFVSKEDQGRLFVTLKGTEGTGFAAIQPELDEIERRMVPMMAPSGPIASMAVRNPGRNGEHEVMLIIDLVHWDQRQQSVFEVGNEIRKRLAPMADFKVSPMVKSSFGSRARAPVELVIGGGSYQQVKAWVDKVLAKASDNPNLLDLDSDYEETTPRIRTTINQAYAHELGISVAEIANTLETVLAGRDITTYIENGEEYDVNVRAPRAFFDGITDLANIHLRSDHSGDLVRLDSLVTVLIEGQPNQLKHFNRRKAITISADLADGYALGQALEYLETIVRDELPDQATIDYKGESLEYQRSSSSMGLVFALALVVVYLVLAAQFESFVHPLVIIMTVPLALTGAFAGMLAVDLTLDIYAQISLIMLIGLATKNGILIVEFINQLRDRGLEFSQAIVQGSVQRLRPIMMTAITTLAGTVPLILASGAGHESRFAIGVVIFSGVLVATLMTLIVTPGLYRLMAVNTTSPGTEAAKLADLDRAHPPGRSAH
ncbi:efflux RND transporter permease subunit [Ferrimonas sp. SCSIO 43195]|uniref:efflux RND transporter permease subunit n=1 Tax=Ferrimonas sp. SCSIO 43195 TaxID=2822844 RepID=UPI00207640D4|nr:efflux RND transporter permease subunit [Ferrimonas sp. SCSIO 43195]USD35888.1 efflux RND transporter permease subunit [Ferrimonas sp. SCSIO 43195]